MAKGATIYKAEAEIADMDRNYYAHHSLTLACHPSETEERMMIRLLAFLMHAGPHLAFGSGVSTEDEPALWEKDLTGSVELWIEVGHPDIRTLKRASGRSRHVVNICYGGRASEVWFRTHQEELTALKNLRIIQVPMAQSQALAKAARRTMDLQCNIQDGAISLISADEMLEIVPELFQSPE